MKHSENSLPLSGKLVAEQKISNFEISASGGRRESVEK